MVVSISEQILERMGMSDKVVVGHLLNSFGRGGMESVLAKVINSLDAQRYRHVVVTVCDDLSLSENISNQNAVFRCLKGSSVSERLFELHNVVKDEGIDVLHARGWSLMLEGGLVSLFNAFRPYTHSMARRTTNSNTTAKYGA